MTFDVVTVRKNQIIYNPNEKELTFHLDALPSG